eukprot:g1119.t1
MKKKAISSTLLEIPSTIATCPSDSHTLSKKNSPKLRKSQRPSPLKKGKGVLRETAASRARQIKQKDLKKSNRKEGKTPRSLKQSGSKYRVTKSEVDSLIREITNKAWDADGDKSASNEIYRDPVTLPLKIRTASSPDTTVNGKESGDSIDNGDQSGCVDEEDALLLRQANELKRQMHEVEQKQKMKAMERFKQNLRHETGVQMQSIELELMETRRRNVAAIEEEKTRVLHLISSFEAGLDKKIRLLNSMKAELQERKFLIEGTANRDIDQQNKHLELSLAREHKILVDAMTEQFSKAAQENNWPIF